MQPPEPSPAPSAADSAAGGGQARALAGGALAYAYNFWVGRFPSRHLRRCYLRAWLARFGAGSGVQLGVRFLNGRKISLGARTVLNFGTLLDGRKFPIEIGDDVSIGPEATILTLGHDPQSPDFSDFGGPVVIGRRAWIAYRALVMPGVTIGEGAIVGAGAVVVKDVAPFTIVVGSPARPVGTRNPALNYTLNFDPFLG